MATNKLKIKVIGVGGAGIDTINSVIDSKINNVECYVVNTDKFSFKRAKTENKVLIGNNDVGVGGDAELGRKCAEESIDKLKNVVSGADAVIITAGMGGGTGTGASSVIAKLAKELNVPAIAVVTKPFKVEGKPRIDTALNGIEELKKYTKFIFVMEADNVYKLINNETNYEKLYNYIDDILKITIEEINNIINSSKNVIGIDVVDLKNIGKENFVNLI